MQSEAELANSTIGVQAQHLVKPEVRVTPQIGGEIKLIRYYDRARGTKEYGTLVLGFPVNNNPGERLSRAQDALDAARDQLPEIRIKVEALREAQAAQIANNTVSKAEVMAAFGDTGPLPATAEEAGEHPANFDDPDAPKMAQAVAYGGQPSTQTIIQINAGDVSGTLVGAVLESL